MTESLTNLMLLMMLFSSEQQPQPVPISSMGAESATMQKRSVEDAAARTTCSDYAFEPRSASTNVEAVVDGTLPSMQKEDTMMIVMKEKQKTGAQSTTILGSSISFRLSGNVWLQHPPLIASLCVTSVVEGEGGDVHDLANFPPLDYQEVGESLCVMPTWERLVANPDDEAHATVSSNVFSY